MEVLYGSGYPRGGPGPVKGPSVRSGTGRDNLREVRDGSGTGLGPLVVVRAWLGDARG